MYAPLLEPPVRDVQKTERTVKKIFPVGGPAAKKTSAPSGPHRSQPSNQRHLSPSPPPFPSPPPSPPPPAFPLPSPPIFKNKTPITSAATKKTSSSSSSQLWHQPTKGPPSPSPPPVPSPPPSSSCPWSPNPATPSSRREPCHNPRQTGQRQDQPWNRGPRFVDPSETPVERIVGRTQSQQPTQATNRSHAQGRSGSLKPSNGYDNVDVHGINPSS